MAVPYIMVDPVHDLANIITTIGRRNNYNGNTIVTFSFKDNNGRSVFLNRIEGKPLLLQELFHQDVEILSQLFQILTNSNEELEFGKESMISPFYSLVVHMKQILLFQMDNQIRPRENFPNLIKVLRISHYHL